MPYELIEHTADVGLRVWAADLEALFAEAARGLVAVMGKAAGPTTHRERVVVEAPDLEALLVDWLSEILYLFEVRGLVPREVHVRLQGPGPWRLEAEVAGPDASRLRQSGPAVKAVTYHGLEVRRGPEGAEARVYLDV